MTDSLISLRIDSGALKRADALAARLAKVPEIQAGVGRVTRSYVLRVALERGLASLEEEYPRPRRRKRS